MPVRTSVAQEGSGTPPLHNPSPHPPFHSHSLPSTAPCLHPGGSSSRPLRAVLAPTTARSRVTWIPPFCLNTVSKWLTQRERGEAPDTFPKSFTNHRACSTGYTHGHLQESDHVGIKGTDMAQELPTHHEKCLQYLPHHGHCK